MRMNFSDYIVIVIYLILVVVIGIYCSRNEKSSEDYLLGGRKMPWFAVGISCMMSLLSTYSLVMVPGEIFNHGLSLWVLYFIDPIFTIFAFTVFTRFYFRLNAFTPFEYLEYRYDAKVRGLVATLYTYTRMVYLGMVLFSTSKVFEGGAGWPAWITILVVGIFGIGYTILGGMKAVIWTDVLQFFVLIGGIGVAVVMLCIKIDGGFWGVISYALEHGRGPTRFADPAFYVLNPYVRLSFWLILLGRILDPLSMAASDQITIQRLLSTSSYKNAFKAQVTSALLGWPFMLILCFIGLAVFSFYSLNPDPRITGGDTAFFVFIGTQLPSPIPGLILAAMLAAVMSTLDSGINSMATIYLKEFHGKYREPKMSDKREVVISRWATAWAGIITVVLGLIITFSSNWLGQAVIESATIFYALNVIIFPAFLYAVISKRANSTLIWASAGLLWGLQFGSMTWYTVARKATLLWREGQPLGWSGPISPLWIMLPAGLALIIFAIWILRKRREVYLLSAALFPTGYGISIALWCICSNLLNQGKPMELSYQWVGIPGTITFLLIGLFGLRLCKIQPKEKYHNMIYFE